MANVNDPRGFLLYQPAQGRETRTEWLRVKASTTIYPGQPVKRTTAGVSGSGVQVVEPVAAAADIPCGIAIGYATAGATDVVRVLVCTDFRDHLWRVQTDGAFAYGDIGKMGAQTATAADATLKQARNFITYSTLAAAPGDISDGTLWQIEGLVPEAGNAFGAYADIIVRYSYTPQPAA